MVGRAVKIKRQQYKSQDPRIPGRGIEKSDLLQKPANLIEILVGKVRGMHPVWDG